MATTTPNFGWPVPTSTDLVKDGATAIEALGDGVDASLVDLKGGTTGQVLSKTSGTDLDFTWVTTDDTNAIQNAIVDAKGDLIGATAADTPARLAVGANGTVLTADSTQSTGLAYTTAATRYPWTAFTPTLNNWTLGNGTCVGEYQQIGKTVILFFKFTFGSTSSLGAFPNFVLPLNAANTLGQSFWCNLQDAGTIDMAGQVYVSTTNVYPGAINSSGTYISISAISTTVPFTWTTNDTVTVQITYEAA
jgi:hypothetical protein